MPDSAGFGPVVMNPISSEVTREVCERGCGALAVLGLPPSVCLCLCECGRPLHRCVCASSPQRGLGGRGKQAGQDPLEEPRVAAEMETGRGWGCWGC